MYHIDEKSPGLREIGNVFVNRVCFADPVRRISFWADRSTIGSSAVLCIFNHRLLSTVCPSKPSRQAWVRFQSFVDLHHALSPRQKGDQSIQQLLRWAILDDLICDLHLLLSRLEHPPLFELSADRCQRRVSGKIDFDPFTYNERLFHSDGSLEIK